MNGHLNCIPAWFMRHKVILIFKKSKALHLTRSDSYNLFLQDYSIENSRSVKYLGIYLDGKFIIGDHIKYLYSKLISHISIVIGLWAIVPKNIFLRYYTVNIKSEVLYGLLILTIVLYRYPLFAVNYSNVFVSTFYMTLSQNVICYISSSASVFVVAPSTHL